MTTLSPAPTLAAVTGRDRSLDLLRAACTVLVVLVHALMVGVTVSGGMPVFENAMDAEWFAPVSWFVQMMPLFFLAGGATAVGAWRRARARGETAGQFASGRIRRLLAPAVVAMAVMGAGLVALGLAGVPAEIVAVAGFRMSQPLWFLGVFALVQALVPAMVALHERRPAWGVAGPLLAVIAIDAARLATGVEAIGFLGLAAVWLLVQQLGFLLGDGVLARIPADARAAATAGALGLLALLTSAGPYSPDMYVNLNPPTLALVLLATAQVMLFSLLQPALRRLAAVPRVASWIDAIGDRAMTIYLWHMPVLIGLAGVLALLGIAGALDLPAPSTGAWWLTRPAWLVAAGVAVAAVTLLAGRFERGAFGPAAGGLRAAAAAILAVVAVALIFVLGLSGPVAALSAGVMLLALRLTRARAGDIHRRHAPAARIPAGRAARDR